MLLLLERRRNLRKLDPMIVFVRKLLMVSAKMVPDGTPHSSEGAMNPDGPDVGAGGGRRYRELSSSAREL